MSWHARLQLDHTLASGRTVARHQHSGPLRILQSLYPEGDAICHNVLVHPPGGLVGGDTLEIGVHTAGGSHALLTTPGATRFYRSRGQPALQHTRLQVDDGGRLEWLPLEAILHTGCNAENRLELDPAPGGELIGWDVTALGLPHAGQPFETGSFRQHIELPGVWLERGRIDATDTLLRNSPLGLAGHQCLASLFFCAGKPLERARAQQALDSARAVMQDHALAATAGATSPNSQVVVVRVLAPVVEPAMQLLRMVWAQWRQALWGVASSTPRIWAT